MTRRLCAADMLTPYGLRCLSRSDPHCAPFAYHRGSVWPFDTAVVAWGMRTYGHTTEATALLRGLLRGIAIIGSPIEAWTVIDRDLIVSPTPFSGHILALRRLPLANRTQAFSAAALLYAIAVLAQEAGVALDSAG